MDTKLQKAIWAPNYLKSCKDPINILLISNPIISIRRGRAIARVSLKYLFINFYLKKILLYKLLKLYVNYYSLILRNKFSEDILGNLLILWM